MQASSLMRVSFSSVCVHEVLNPESTTWASGPTMDGRCRMRRSGKWTGRLRNSRPATSWAEGPHLRVATARSRTMSHSPRRCSQPVPAPCSPSLSQPWPELNPSTHLKLPQPRPRARPRCQAASSIAISALVRTLHPSPLSYGRAAQTPADPGRHAALCTRKRY